MSVSLWANIALQDAPEDLSPHKARTTTITPQPESDPNSRPATIQIFLRQGACRHAFDVSVGCTSKSFCPVAANATRTLSRETTEEHVVDASNRSVTTGNQWWKQKNC
jgi:hypothetical protein